MSALSREIKSKILTVQKGEITEHFIYEKLAKMVVWQTSSLLSFCSFLTCFFKTSICL